MRAIKVIDGLDIYVLIFQPLDPDSDELHVHSCWRFRTGRTNGEKVAVGSLPWDARQQIADITGDPSHL